MNRSNIYGDLLFESIRIVGIEPQYLALHYKRLMHGMRVLKFDFRKFDFEIFEKEVCEAVKNHRTNYPQSSEILRLRFVVYRNANGFYLPDSHKIEYITEVFPFEPKVTEKPLRIGVFEEQTKSPGPLSNIKSGNSLIYVMASIWAREKELDDALILNSKGNIIEASSSNIFWRINRQWFTPPLSDGCVEGIMREVFMGQNKVIEKSCSMSELNKADEILLSNAIQGLRKFEIAN